jgi:hypothetical protein
MDFDKDNRIEAYLDMIKDKPFLSESSVNNIGKGHDLGPEAGDGSMWISPGPMQDDVTDPRLNPSYSRTLLRAVSQKYIIQRSSFPTRVINNIMRLYYLNIFTRKHPSR